MLIKYFILKFSLAGKIQERLKKTNSIAIRSVCVALFMLPTRGAAVRRFFGGFGHIVF